MINTAKGGTNFPGVIDGLIDVGKAHGSRVDTVVETAEGPCPMPVTLPYGPLAVARLSNLRARLSRLAMYVFSADPDTGAPRQRSS